MELDATRTKPLRRPLPESSIAPERMAATPDDGWQLSSLARKGLCWPMMKATRPAIVRFAVPQISANGNKPRANCRLIVTTPGPVNASAGVILIRRDDPSKNLRSGADFVRAVHCRRTDPASKDHRATTRWRVIPVRKLTEGPIVARRLESNYSTGRCVLASGAGLIVLGEAVLPS